MTTIELPAQSCTSHREVIEEYALKGYKYLGFVPVKLGPSGKMLALDLVFDNK